MDEIEKQLEKNPDLFLQDLLFRLSTATIQLTNLARKYHCVVDNPPYMGSGAMNSKLSSFVRSNYPASKADLMACFMEAGLAALRSKGFLGMINQHSWMFLSSYDKLRENLIEKIFIDTLLHLGSRTFPEIGGEVVQNSSFTFWNKALNDEGKYIRLVNFGKSELKREKLIDTISNSNHHTLFTFDQDKFKLIPGFPIGYWFSERKMNLFNKNYLEDYGEPRQGLATSDNNRFLRFWQETSMDVNVLNNTEGEKWYPFNKGGSFRKWYGNQDLLINWENNGEEVLAYAKKLYKSPTRTIKNIKYYFREGVTFSLTNTNGFGARLSPEGFIFDVQGSTIFSDGENLNYITALLNSNVASSMMEVLSPTMVTHVGYLKKLPMIEIDNPETINKLTKKAIELSRTEWDSRETSWNFKQNELINKNGQDIEEAFNIYCQYWKKKFFQLRNLEVDLNQQFIDLYGLQAELSSDVPLEEITLLKDETDTFNDELVFDRKEIFAQFISYAVGCMFGRYSLDKEALILANQGETLEDYLEKVALSEVEVSFLPDDDNIIPVLDDEWFEDDIVGRFYEFLKASFGKENFDKNLAFVEECIGKDIRKYFVKDFYKDHTKRYKKRPIYWIFSSPKGSFNVLIYMHRYTPDTLNNILNGYLVEYREKLKARIEHLDHVIETGSSTEQTRAAKEKDRLRSVLLELQEYEREILYPLATERISIDLDDGVLVNYNKFGKAIQEVKGLNDKKAKEKVRKFDWIETEAII